MTVPNAVRHRGDRLGATAAADLKLKEYHVGVIDSTGKIALAGANPGRVVAGILIGAPESGGDATLQIANVSQAVIGAAVANRNTLLTSNASGRLIPATTGQYAQFMSLSTGTADGQVITVVIAPFGLMP